jgi:hypothetical protein
MLLSDTFSHLFSYTSKGEKHDLAVRKFSYIWGMLSKDMCCKFFKQGENIFQRVFLLLI